MKVINKDVDESDPRSNGTAMGAISVGAVRIYVTIMASFAASVMYKGNLIEIR